MSQGDADLQEFASLSLVDFNPYLYANALVLATNDTSDIVTDFRTPISRATFELEDVKSEIKQLVIAKQIEDGTNS